MLDITVYLHTVKQVIQYSNTMQVAVTLVMQQNSSNLAEFTRPQLVTAMRLLLLVGSLLSELRTDACRALFSLLHGRQLS